MKFYIHVAPIGIITHYNAYSLKKVMKIEFQSVLLHKPKTVIKIDIQIMSFCTIEKSHED